MHRLPAFRLLALLAATSIASCQPPQTASSSASSADGHPLAFLAAQRVVVTPTHALNVASELGWTSVMGRSRDVLKSLDTDIASALEERGLRRGWVLPEELVASYARNRSYGSDPYLLAEAPLRSPNFIVGSKLPEPLASQLRTMIALHDDARLVLAPVELRFERAGAGSAGRATLRLALLDPRTSEARWVGQVRSDTASTFSPVLTATLARRVADLVAPP